MGRVKLPLKSKGVLTRHLLLIGGTFNDCSTKKKNDVTSIDFIYHSNGKTKRSSKVSSRSSTQIKIDKSFCTLDNFLVDLKNYETKKKSSEEQTNKTRKPLAVINDFSNRKKLFQENVPIEEEEPIKKKMNRKNSLSKKIYSKKYLVFENEITHKSHYIKKFKEDEIPFTKSKILPEIQWQEIDNDVLTSDDQKKNAQKKEMNWLTETVKMIQCNDKYLKNHLYMYKMAKKYPSNE